MACNITQTLRLSLLVFLYVRTFAHLIADVNKVSISGIIAGWLLSVSLQLLWPVSLWVYSFMKRLMTLLMRSELKLCLLSPFPPI